MTFVVTGHHAISGARLGAPSASQKRSFGCRLTKSSSRKVLPYAPAVQSDRDTPGALPTVLVMDDEPFVRQAARRFLRGSGYGCIEAESVDAALEILRHTPVIAAMLDMRLQDGRTGIDVLTDLRRNPEFQEIPVMIVTGSLLSDTEAATIAKHRGFVFFKPEGFSTIVNFLDRLTGRDHSS